MANAKVTRLKTKPPIIELEDYTESINMLIYGDSGVGKTVLAGTAPNALILGMEPGTISAKRQGSKAKLWKIPTWDELRIAYKWLKDNPDHGFDWIVLDSITKMQQIALRSILDAAVAENAKRDLDIPAIQDHQKWQNMMKRFVNAFNDLPVNVLYTALAFRNENDDGDDLVLPLLTGKGYQIAQSICADMHIVGYLATEVKGKGKDAEITRNCLWQSKPPFFAKDRYNALGRWMADPTMPKIIEMIEAVPTEKPAKAAPKKRVAAITPTNSTEESE